MRTFVIVILILQYSNYLFSQKKPLDTAAYRDWPVILNERISNNGKYLLYIKDQQTFGPILVIKDIDHSSEVEIGGVENAVFNKDSKAVFFRKRGDTLGIFQLNTKAIQLIPNVNSYKVPSEGNGQWIGYELTAPKKELVIRDLLTGAERKYARIKNYRFHESGNALFLHIEETDSPIDSVSLLWVHLPGFKTDTIKQGVFKVGNITLHGAQLAFITKINTQDENENILWYYRTGMQSAVVKVDDAALSKLPGERLTDDLLAFSKDGNSIIFSLKPSDILADARKMVTSNGLVDVWNYKDQYLQAQQIKERDYLANKYFTAVVAVNSGRVIQVNQKGDDWDIKFANNGNEAYALVGSNKNRWETYWRTSERVTGYLISLKDGSRRIICDHLLDAQNPAVFSAKGKYVIWYDREKKTYFTYNLSTGMAKNITANFSVPLYDDEDDHPHPPYDFGIAAWLENDTAVLIYDRYDIWKVDPDGKKKPVNITMGYGQKNKVVLRYLNLNERNAAGASTIKGDTILLLTAFNRVNKYNGFYSLNLDQKKAPEELSMGPYIYHLPQLSISSFLFFPWVPIKVESTKRYVVRRMSATEFPNLFVTSDFREFTQLTNIQPQKAYNWMTSELVSWKMPDGKMTTGILYKPEDFNPQKKYPVIFYVYEQLTDGINAFIKPEMSPGPINIPSYVSNDYIIFIPDIHYKIGYPGESAYNTVVSAANHLAKNSWVDKKRMGIQGHSFGGYEVNYIVTRTNLFAAAMSGAGPADLVSMYGSLREGAVSSQLLFENFQFRIGATLWAKPDLFIKNSPVFYSNKVSTPLLIMHNKEDDIVSWTQGIEFFTALRRQNKRVWMLQYDGYGHSVEGKAAEDYSLRMTQFFNHYLKGTPAPEWMVKGIPATKKGIENGFEMDSLNANP